MKRSLEADGPFPSWGMKFIPIGSPQCHLPWVPGQGPRHPSLILSGAAYRALSRFGCVVPRRPLWHYEYGRQHVDTDAAWGSAMLICFGVKSVDAGVSKPKELQAPDQHLVPLLGFSCCSDDLCRLNMCHARRGLQSAVHFSIFTHAAFLQGPARREWTQ